MPRLGGHEPGHAHNVGKLLDAALCEPGAEESGLQACRSRAIDVQMATVYANLIGRWSLAKATWSRSKMGVDRHPEGFIGRA
jgi:hypothetical protein